MDELRFLKQLTFADQIINGGLHVWVRDASKENVTQGPLDAS
jgi:hypothetical protein